MAWQRPTYRTVDGERIEGAWCHVWRRHRPEGRWFVEDLIVFADGDIRCGDRTDVAGLEKLLASGMVAPTEPGVSPRAAEPSKWLARRPEPLTPEGFLADVADRIEVLSGRPSAGERCWEAIQRYQHDPTEHHRALLRHAYLAVPAHLRVYLLGDMDGLDRPLRILLTDIGEPVDGDGPVVREDMHQSAIDYFRRGDARIARAQEQRAMWHADDPGEGTGPAVVSNEVVFPRGWPETPGLFVLRNEYPAPVEFAGETYPSVLHGYWSLSAADTSDRRRIADAPSVREAHDLGGRAARRADWSSVRLAVMTGLLRAKFTQHAELAEILLSTGDAAISYTGLSDSPFWTDLPDHRGRNWVGRLLELTRSELIARQSLAEGRP